MKRVIVIAAALIVALSSRGDCFADGNLNFESGDNGTCTLVQSPDATGDVVIPEIASDGETDYRVTSIAPSAFQDSRSILSVTLPPTIQSIGDDAFRNCPYLRKVFISDMRAWLGIDFSNENSNPLSGYKPLIVNGEELTNLEIVGDITTVKQYALYDCSSLRTVTMAEGVVRISHHAFDGCENLEEVNFPETLRVIGTYAFNINISLKSLDLPAGLTSIGEGAFYRCSSITSLKRPLTVETIPELCFAGCTRLSGQIIAEGVKNIGMNAFFNCLSIEEIEFPQSVSMISTYAFDTCTSLRSVKICNPDMSLGHYVFSECTALTSINLPEHMTALPDGVLSLCTSLEEIKLPAGLTEICEYALAGCQKLKYIDFPESLESIGTRAFYGCFKITEVEFGPYIKSIGTESFYQCPVLAEIRCRALEPPVLSFFGFDINHDRNARVIVPEISLEAYRAAYAWRNFDHLEGSESMNPDSQLTIRFEGSGEFRRAVAYGSQPVLTLRSVDGELPSSAVLSTGENLTDKIDESGRLTLPPVRTPVTLTLTW